MALAVTWALITTVCKWQAQTVILRTPFPRAPPGAGLCCESVEGAEPSVALCLLVKSYTQFCGGLGPLVSRKAERTLSREGNQSRIPVGLQTFRVSLLEGSEKPEPWLDRT